jgi:transcriptional regulator with XRE-family HTH domain
MEFRDRLRLAAKHAGVEYSQTAIAKSLKRVGKQTVDRWMADGMPSAEMLYHIADTWKVNPRWLAVEQGDMIVAPIADAKLKSSLKSDAEKLLVVVRTFLDTDEEGKDEFVALATTISLDNHGAQSTTVRRARRR